MAKECWARCLGDCDDKITKEHYVSKNFFGTKTVMVQGLPQCMDKPVEMPLEGLSRAMLCERHNNRLGEDVDEIASGMLNMLAESLSLAQDREEFRRRHYFPIRRTFDGLLLERWFVKTLINLCFKGSAGIGPGGDRTGWPTDHLVRVAFGETRLEGVGGLYVVAEAGENVMIEERLRFVRLHDTHNEDNIAAAHFLFCGMRFLLDLRSTDAEEAWFGPPAMRHLNRIVWTNTNRRGKQVPSVVVNWKW
ncbi:CoA transferase [Terriglobus sp. RCC_193]|uniref:CoA transferase n=1 Tax=Terriglobus sp. RCC_193 TaxID=3239218 RepID=UPI003525E307